MGTRSGKTAAFTLIELLVVIAIIAILAAILFPVFATAREKARQTTCASNLKQLGIGVLQYVQDYDEYYPAGPNPTANCPGRGWAGQIFPYVKTTNVFTCPDDTTVSQDVNNPMSISYAINSDTLTPQSGNTWGVTFAQPQSSFIAPASTVELYEVSGLLDAASAFLKVEMNSPAGLGFCYQPSSTTAGMSALAYWVNVPCFGRLGTSSAWPSGAQTYIPALDGSSNATASNGQPWPKTEGTRHSGGANYLMADGHVKWLMPTAVSVGLPISKGITWCPQAASVNSLGTFSVTFSLN